MTKAELLKALARYHDDDDIILSDGTPIVDVDSQWTYTDGHRGYRQIILVDDDGGELVTRMRDCYRRERCIRLATLPRNHGPTPTVPTFIVAVSVVTIVLVLASWSLH